MKLLYTSLTFVALLMIFGSCDKQKQLERRLAKDTWQVDRMEWTLTTIDTSGVTILTGVETAAGEYRFKDGDDGTEVLRYNGITQTRPFDYTNSATTIRMNYDAGISFDPWTAANGRPVTVITVVEGGRKEMVWDVVETGFTSSGDYSFVADMEVSKKK